MTSTKAGPLLEVRNLRKFFPIVQGLFRKVTGQGWTLRIEGAPSGPATEASEKQAPTRPKRNSREEAEKVPLVDRAVKALGASIQRVDDGFGETPET